MALVFCHRPYLLVAVLAGLIITGCSTSGIKEKQPTSTQQLPTVCPIKKHESAIHLFNLHFTEKSTPADTYTLAKAPEPLFQKSFAFQYDNVVDRLLNATTHISFYPQADLAKQLNDLNQDTFENYPPQSRKEIIKPVVKLLGRSENFKQVEMMLNKARRFVGVPYRRGGTSPQGFDCSGLVYYTLKNTGVSIPRTAHDQYLHSTPIKKSELRPGDLVFFRTNRRVKRITHVGIYLGENKFIHARSGGKRVDITDLSDSYYSTRFVRGGRIL